MLHYSVGREELTASHIRMTFAPSAESSDVDVFNSRVVIEFIRASFKKTVELLKIYGKDSEIGKSITLVADAGGENDYTGCSYRIAGILNTGDDSEQYVYAPLVYNADVVKIFANIADGYTAKEVQHALNNAGLKRPDNGTPISFAVIEPNVMHVEEILAYIVVTIFSWLIFLIGFITFMKFMIQMFYTRQRELALRKCVGSKNKGLYMMLASEVTAMLACAFAVSCITSEVSFNYISYMHFGYLFSFSSLIVAQFETTLIAFAISLVVILFPIMRLRRVDMKGAMLRRRQGKKMKNKRKTFPQAQWKTKVFRQD